MHIPITLPAVAFALSVAAAPTSTAEPAAPSSSPNPVTFIHPALEPLSKLPHAPATLTPSETTFLTTFQPLVANLTLGDPIASGWCFAEYPCHSISNAATASLHSTNNVPLPGITPADITALLTLLLHTQTMDLKPSLFDGVSTNSLSTDKIDLTLYALPLTIPSSAIAGAVFDLYKINADSTANVNGDSNSNAIRGVQVDQRFTVCLRPNGADPTAAQNFCLGRELDGSMPPPSSSSSASSSASAATAVQSEIAGPEKGKGKRHDLLAPACGVLGGAPILGALLAPLCDGPP